MQALEVDNVSVQYNCRCEFVLIDNRPTAVQIPKNISLERLNDGAPLVLPTATARRISDSEAYRTHSMLIDLNVE
jgi:hypothetical protein